MAFIKWIASAFSILRLRRENAELRKLLREIYDWTHYKDTHWAKRAAKALNRKEI